MPLSQHKKAKNNEETFHKNLPAPGKNCFLKKGTKDNSYFIISDDLSGHSYVIAGLLAGIYSSITYAEQRKQNKDRNSDLRSTLRFLQTS